MTPVDLGRLGLEVQRLFGWPPAAPREVRTLRLTDGDGLEAGRTEADRIVDSGVDLLVLEASGPPDLGLAVIAVLLDLEPVRVVGTAGGPGWAARVVAVRDHIRRLRPAAGDPSLLVGDPLLGRLTGVLLRCSERRTPVLLSGDDLVLAAALAALRLSVAAPTWWLPASRPSSAAGRAVLDALRLEPLLDLDLQVGGPQLALGLLLGAVQLAAPTDGLVAGDEVPGGGPADDGGAGGGAGGDG